MVFFLKSGVLFTYIMKIMYLSMYIFQAQDAVSKLENLYDEMQEDLLEFGYKTNSKITTSNLTTSASDIKKTICLENLSFKLKKTSPTRW